MGPTPADSPMAEAAERIRVAADRINDVLAEVRQVIVGQNALLDRLMIALLADGHILLEGVPGLAKTLSINTLAEVLQARFSRVQFTPDLLPADLIGTSIYDARHASFTTRRGPIFANLVLADEINRAPAKVQSALLEAMQERQVTIAGESLPLPHPFLVLATQNPIEQEGTYPLPEAQLDRFMLKVRVGYPTKSEELDIIDRMTGGQRPSVRKLTSLELIGEARRLVADIHVADKIKQYIVELVFASRQPADHGLAELAPLIAFGAGPRASIFLTLAAKAHAFLKRRAYVLPEDVKAIAPDVLRHRLLLSYEAEADDVTVDEVVRTLLAGIKVP